VAIVFDFVVVEVEVEQARKTLEIERL